MKAKPKLKPCPFCGGRKIMQCISAFACVDCGAYGPSGKTVSEAVRLWNTRPNEVVTKAK